MNLELINAEELYYAPLIKTSFLVEDLLPQGLNILCGASKIGKSWFVLWLCLKLAKGESVWDKETKECGVLYLALEDTKARLQNRLHQLTDEPPSNFNFATFSEGIQNGLCEQIENHIKTFPTTKLVVIDTLQKIRKNIGNGQIQYANDYEDLSKIKTLADQLNICILLVHHTRKTADASDPFNEISGSNGIMGTADNSYVLKKESRNSKRAVLHICGRDLGQSELILEFENMVWNLISSKDSEELVKEEIPDFLFRLVSFLQDKMKWEGTMAELLSEMKMDLKPNQASKNIAQFYGEVLEPENITYTTKRLAKGRVFAFGVSVDSADSVDEFDG